MNFHGPRCGENMHNPGNLNITQTMYGAAVTPHSSSPPRRFVLDFFDGDKSPARNTTENGQPSILIQPLPDLIISRFPCAFIYHSASRTGCNTFTSSDDHIYVIPDFE